MSPPPPSQSFKIPLRLNADGTRSSVIEKARKRIFEKLKIRGAPPSTNSPYVINHLDERLLAIISKCERFAIKGKITLIVSLNGPYTLKNAKDNILDALFFECEEAELASAVQDVIDDLKEFKRRADIVAQVAREKKAVEDGLYVILWRLARSDYCEVIPRFNKSSCSFEFTFIDRGETDFSKPLKEDEFLWDPETQKNEIRGFLYSNLNSGFPWEFYYYQWRIYRYDPEDFDSEEMEFQNLLDDNDESDSDVDYGKRLIRERREAYENAIRAAGGVFSFVANFYFDHVVSKILYAVPVVGEVMMAYDLAQLASEFPDGVRAFSKIILEDKDI